MEAMIAQLLDLSVWIQAMEAQVQEVQPLMERLGSILAVAGLVFSGGLRTMLRGNGAGSVMVRTFVAALLITATPAISTLVVDVWDDLRSAASDQLITRYETAATALDDISLEMIELGEHSVLLSNTNTPSQAAQRALADQEDASDILRRTNGWANYATVALLINVGVVFFLLVLTGIAVTVANVALPLGAGLLTFRGGLGDTILARYVSVVMSSLVLVMLFPLGFSVVFEIGAVQPLTTFQASMEANNDAFETLLSDIDGDSAEVRIIARLEEEIGSLAQQVGDIRSDPANREGRTVGTLWLQNPLTPGAKARVDALGDQIRTRERRISDLKSGFFDKLLSKVSAHLTQVTRELKTIVGAAAFMLLCVFAGVYGMLRLEGYIATLVGGFVPGATGAAIAGAGAALAAGRIAAGMLGAPNLGGGKGAATTASEAPTMARPKYEALPSSRDGGPLARQSQGLATRPSSGLAPRGGSDLAPRGGGGGLAPQPSGAMQPSGGPQGMWLHLYANPLTKGLTPGRQGGLPAAKTELPGSKPELPAPKRTLPAPKDDQ